MSRQRCVALREFGIQAFLEQEYLAAGGLWD